MRGGSDGPPQPQFQCNPKENFLRRLRRLVFPMLFGPNDGPPHGRGGDCKGGGVCDTGEFSQTRTRFPRFEPFPILLRTPVRCTLPLPKGPILGTHPPSVPRGGGGGGAQGLGVGWLAAPQGGGGKGPEIGGQFLLAPFFPIQDPCGLPARAQPCPCPRVFLE